MRLILTSDGEYVIFVLGPNHKSSPLVARLVSAYSRDSPRMQKNMTLQTNEKIFKKTYKSDVLPSYKFGSETQNTTLL